ncbi:MAG: protein kinase [Planctomycetota bacterium]
MTSSPDRERELFEACLSMPIGERFDYLQARSGGDTELTERIELLLAAHALAESEPSGEAVEGDPPPDLEDLTQVGPFRILEVLGEGGMGVVYRAEQRQPFRRLVALKVIKAGMDTRQVIARFEVERQALALMEHPAIAKVFDAGATETGRPYFAMEYVQGAPITEFCDARKLSLRDRLRLFMEVCEGVQHAHNRGVIHRDLKPSNVLVASVDGRPSAKIIDFGVAKATGGKLTAETVHTAHGALVGTPAYMSPEQADSRSGDIDPRADVYALGVILYELCVGRPPFDRLSLVSGGLESMLQKIREERAERPSAMLRTRDGATTEVAERRSTEVAVLRDEVAGDLDWITLKALEKDRDGRYGTPAELRADLDRFLTQRTVLARPAPVLVRTGRWLRRHSLALALAAALFAMALNRSPSSTGGATARLSVHVPRASALYASGAPNLTVSPDGRTIAWVGGEARELHVRHVDDFTIRRLRGTEGAVGPFFSPDGAWIGYFDDGSLNRVAVASGDIEVIAATASTALASRGATWGDDGSIVYVPHFTGGLLRIAAAPGASAEWSAPEAITEIDVDGGERTHRWPQLLPGSKEVLFTVDDDRTQDFYDDASIVALSLQTGERRVLVQRASRARYADGRLVFARGGSLYAQPFEPGGVVASGPAVESVVGVETDASTGAVMFDLSRDGTLVHAPGADREASLDLVLRALDGSARELDLLPAGYQQPRVSPDGTRICYVLAGSGGGDAWVYDINRGLASRLTDSGTVRSPVWSGDGARLLFGVDDGAIESLQLDRDGGTARLAATERGGLLPVDVTSDGERLIAVLNRPGLQWDIVEVDLETGDVKDLVATAATEGGADLHPSGKWLAYSSDRSGRREVYLADLPEMESLYPVTSGGGMDVKWSPEGDALFYVRPGTDELWAVDVTLGPRVTLGTPRLALTGIYAEEDVNHNFDVTPDGRILALRDGSDIEVGRELRVQPGWTGELAGDE